MGSLVTGDGGIVVAVVGGRGGRAAHALVVDGSGCCSTWRIFGVRNVFSFAQPIGVVRMWVTVLFPFHLWFLVLFSA